MAIAALSQATARVLTSSVALNDATSVVKELVDNALDAGASSIIIEISNNTIDTIQVKDNGRGIGIEDRQLLCKKGCTSKIRTIEDLSLLGGRSLGFRGEALASAANISSSVIITTRIEGETVATTLKFGPNGKMLSSSSASHAVGTTVRVQDLLSNVPVRKQSVLKNTAKILSNTRKLLLSYAFARPEVRFAFKILKGKNDKLNWTYAPSRATSTMLEDVTKIVGKEVAAQLQHQHITSEHGTDHHYAIDALLIASATDAEKACNMDLYFSVDQRPVNADKDPFKELHKLYKRYLRHAIRDYSDRSLSRPFMCLRLSCPPQTYDINVEPAKDRVMFYNESHVSEMFEAMLKQMYGEITTVSTNPRSASVGPVEDDSFSIMMARPKNVGTSKSDSPLKPDQPTEVAIAPPRGSEEDEAPALDNPWTKARMNIRLNRSNTLPEDAVDPSLVMRAEVRAAASPDATSEAIVETTGLEAEQLLTPARSSDGSEGPFQNPGPPMRRRGPRVSDSEPESPPPSTERGPTLLEGWIQASQRIRPHRSDASHNENQLREGQPSMRLSSRSPSVPRELQETQEPGTRSPTSFTQGQQSNPQQRPFVSPFKRPRLSQFPNSSPTPGESMIRPRKQPRNMQAQPINGSSEVSETELDEILEFERQKKAVLQQRKLAMKALHKSQARSAQVNELHEDSRADTQSRPDMSEDDIAEDFASQFAMKDSAGGDRRRANVSGQKAHGVAEVGQYEEEVVPRTSTREKATRPESRLGEVVEDGEGEIRKIADSDPRACLIRQKALETQHLADKESGLSRTGLKIRRAKTSRLPLETVPLGMELHNICIELESPQQQDRDASSANLAEQVAKLATLDEYVRHGKVTAAIWSSHMGDIAEWNRTLSEVLRQKAPSLDLEGLGLAAAMEQAFSEK